MAPRLSQYLLMLALLFLGGCSSGPSSHAALSEPFFFIQLSDTQLGMETNNQDFNLESARLQEAVGHINRLRPAFVVITGDLIHKPGDAGQIAEFQRLVALIDPAIPVHLVSGNHDIEAKPTAASLQAYRQTFGPDWYSFQYGRCHFIVWNTTIVTQPHLVPAEQLAQWDWLRHDLAHAAAQQPAHIIVFGHHPLFTRTLDEPDAHGNLPLARRGLYVDMFLDAHVAAHFAGHSHLAASASHHDLQSVITGPLARPFGNTQPGFRIIKVFPDHLEHEYVPLKSDFLTPSPSGRGQGEGVLRPE